MSALFWEVAILLPWRNRAMCVIPRIGDLFRFGEASDALRGSVSGFELRDKTLYCEIAVAMRTEKNPMRAFVRVESLRWVAGFWLSRETDSKLLEQQLSAWGFL